MKSSKSAPRPLRDIVVSLVESLPGGMFYGLDSEAVARNPRDWRAAEARLPPKERAALVKRREKAAHDLARIREVLAELGDDASVPRSIRKRAAEWVAIVDRDDFPPEVRLSFLKLFIEAPGPSRKTLDFNDLFPPRGGALPVPDDTPWAPPRRRSKP
jgi:hypothetical protein